MISNWMLQTLPVGMQNSKVILGKFSSLSPSHTLTKSSSDSTPRYWPECIENLHLNRNLYTNFIDLLIITSTWQHPKCTSTDKWIKSGTAHTMKYYYSNNKEWTLIQETAKINLKMYFINEKSQTQRLQIAQFHLQNTLETPKLQRRQSDQWLAGSHEKRLGWLQ